MLEQLGVWKPFLTELYIVWFLLVGSWKLPIFFFPICYIFLGSEFQIEKKRVFIKTVFLNLEVEWVFIGSILKNKK